MDNRRIRNYLIYSDKSDHLDSILNTLNADHMEYVEDHYKVHFRIPISSKSLRQKTGCQNVQAVSKRLPKHLKRINGIEGIKRSVYQKIYKKYERNLIEGYVIDEFLRYNKLSAVVLDKSDFQLVKFYHAIRGLSNEVPEIDKVSQSYIYS